MRRALDALERNGVVSCFAGGPSRSTRSAPTSTCTAAYYRNTIIHFFVNAAIAELALLRAAEPGAAIPPREFWDEALRLRDLLKFEFFFAEKEIFRDELRASWRSTTATGSASSPPAARRSARCCAASGRSARTACCGPSSRPTGSSATRSSGAIPSHALRRGGLPSECLGVGKQYHLQRRIRSAESVSKVLFETALRLARNRGLLDPGAPDLAERRRAFADEIRAAVRRIDAIDALAASRRRG